MEIKGLSCLENLLATLFPTLILVIVVAAVIVLTRLAFLGLTLPRRVGLGLFSFLLLLLGLFFPSGFALLERVRDFCVRLLDATGQLPVRFVGLSDEHGIADGYDGARWLLADASQCDSHVESHAWLNYSLIVSLDQKLALLVVEADSEAESLWHSQAGILLHDQVLGSHVC